MQAKFGWAVGFILAAFLAVHLHTRVLDQTIVPPPSAVFGIVSGGRTHLLDRDPRPEASFGYYTADPMGSAALYPVDRFILDSWKSGHFPLWNPYVLTGLPLTADGYWQLFYPLNSIRLVIGEGWWDVYSYIHLFLLSIFLALLYYQLRPRPTEAALSAIATFGVGWFLLKALPSARLGRALWRQRRLARPASARLPRIPSPSKPTLALPGSLC